MSSIRNTPCGPPNPRKAVLEVLFVFATRPSTFTFGIQYALSKWHSARLSTGSDRSRHHPPSAVRVASSARMPPSRSNPARHEMWNGCRLPVIVMSCVRFRRRRTGRPVSFAPSAAIAASPCGCISLPPNAPPIRSDCTVTRLDGMPQHVRDDLLRLARMLRGGLHEVLPLGVEVRERRVGFEVEVLLTAELGHALEHERGGGQRGRGVSAQRRCAMRPDTSPRRWPRSR